MTLKSHSLLWNSYGLIASCFRRKKKSWESHPSTWGFGPPPKKNTWSIYLSCTDSVKRGMYIYITGYNPSYGKCLAWLCAAEIQPKLIIWVYYGILNPTTCIKGMKWELIIKGPSIPRVPCHFPYEFKVHLQQISLRSKGHKLSKKLAAWHGWGSTRFCAYHMRFHIKK